MQVLESEGVSRLDVVSYLAHGVSRLQPPYFGGSSPSALPAGDDEDEEDGDRRAAGRPAIP